MPVDINPPTFTESLDSALNSTGTQQKKIAWLKDVFSDFHDTLFHGGHEFLTETLYYIMGRLSKSEAVLFADYILSHESTRKHSIVWGSARFLETFAPVLDEDKTGVKVFKLQGLSHQSSSLNRTYSVIVAPGYDEHWFKSPVVYFNVPFFYGTAQAYQGHLNETPEHKLGNARSQMADRLVACAQPLSDDELYRYSLLQAAGTIRYPGKVQKLVQVFGVNRALGEPMMEPVLAIGRMFGRAGAALTL